MKKYLVGLIVLSLVFSAFAGFGSISFAQKKYNEAPMLAELVKQGKLPPVNQRLPEQPLVLKPPEKIGKYGGTLRTAMLGPSDTYSILQLIGNDSLVRLDPYRNKIVPNLALSFKEEDKGKVFVFRLRKGTKWSDGSPFNADDIMFWYNDVLLNKELTPTIPVWLTIGGKPVKVVKVDDYTVRFEFEQPYGMFLMRLAQAQGDSILIPKNYMKQFHPKYTPKEKLDELVKKEGFQQWYQLFMSKNDIYLNPERPTLFAWKVVTAGQTLGANMVYERNPYYWKVDSAGNQLPYIDKVVYSIEENVEVITMKALSGQLDMEHRYASVSGGSPVQNYPLFMENKEKGGYKIVRIISTRSNSAAYGFNLNHKDPVVRKIYNDKRFRIAMSLAINREEIIKLMGYDKLGSVPYQCAPLPNSPYYHERLAKQYLEYDPEKANQLLDEIGLKRGPDGFRLRPDGKPLLVTIEVIAPHTARIDISQLVKKYWNDVGVKTEVRVIERSLFYTRKAAGEHDVATWGADGGSGIEPILEPRWYFPYSQESLFGTLWALWYMTGGKSGEEPPKEVKRQIALYDKILSTTNESQRKLLFKQLLDIAADQFWGIGICTEPFMFATFRKNIGNLPQEMAASWLYLYPAIYNPTLFFFE
jgi:peptide/nickel transport system substrate-binding protein